MEYSLKDGLAGRIGKEFLKDLLMLSIVLCASNISCLPW